MMLNTINTHPSSSSAEPEMLFLSPFEQRLPRALEDLRNGRPVLLMDDFDRENEADLIVAAEKITLESMARLIRDCSGIVCLCLTDDKLQQLDLPPMVSNNESRYGTAFTVSIEARQGVTTGVSAADRVTTILTAIAPDARPEHLARPGHVFPLRAAPGGVLSRRGHTEGSVDLAQMAGLSPAAVLCELMNPDGSMAKGEQIIEYAVTHDMVVLTIDELARYREQTGV
ncbi:3,4-dihydroxy-2-butanone-4-phosphate synthase [Undibacterium hunanense]|nr:3,4-dihydroxy-2-butanone-4-phosphate synthase [Undibacterium hunanense]